MTKTTPATDNPSRSIIQLALTLHQQGQLDEAERLYTRILQDQHDHFDALHLLGALMHQRGRSEEALNLIAKALATNARSADAYANQGRVLAALKRHDEALASFDRALAIKPDHLEALFHRGNALHDLKRSDEALMSFDRVLALRPNHANVLTNRSAILRDLKPSTRARREAGSVQISFTWGVSAFYGWGVYGLNLALQWAADCKIEGATLEPVNPNELAIDPLRLRALEPFLRRSVLAQTLPRQPGGVVLNSLNNDFIGRDQASSIGVTFFEQPRSPAAIERASRYDIIVTGSSWNESVLRAAGLKNVFTIFQGVDRSLFYPAPKCGLYLDRFLIFSGGKAEPRKGQDIVVKAFRAFAQRHSDAMLVTAWHSPWEHLASAMDLDLMGLAGRVIDVGALPNGRMAPVYRECDVALFPNCCRGRHKFGGDGVHCLRCAHYCIG